MTRLVAGCSFSISSSHPIRAMDRRKAEKDPMPRYRPNSLPALITNTVDARNSVPKMAAAAMAIVIWLNLTLFSIVPHELDVVCWYCINSTI